MGTFKCWKDVCPRTFKVGPACFQFCLCWSASMHRQITVSTEADCFLGTVLILRSFSPNLLVVVGASSFIWQRYSVAEQSRSVRAQPQRTGSYSTSSELFSPVPFCPSSVPCTAAARLPLSNLLVKIHICSVSKPPLTELETQSS